MDHKEIKEIAGLFSSIIQERDAQGRKLLVNSNKMDFQNGMISELDVLEKANSEKKDELLILSRFIRNKLWKSPDNTRQLYFLLHNINSSFALLADIKPGVESRSLRAAPLGVPG